MLLVGVQSELEHVEQNHRCWKEDNINLTTHTHTHTPLPPPPPPVVCRLWGPVGQEVEQVLAGSFRLSHAWGSHQEKAWAMLGHSGPLWATLGRAGPLWATLGRAGPLWAVLGHSGPLWATLGRAGPCRAGAAVCVCVRFACGAPQGASRWLTAGALTGTNCKSCTCCWHLRIRPTVATTTARAARPPAPLTDMRPLAGSSRMATLILKGLALAVSGQAVRRFGGAAGTSWNLQLSQQQQTGTVEAELLTHTLTQRCFTLTSCERNIPPR